MYSRLSMEQQSLDAACITTQLGPLSMSKGWNALEVQCQVDGKLWKNTYIDLYAINIYLLATWGSVEKGPL